MKVAQFINTVDFGGAETVVAEISNELTNRGIENIIFHFGNDWLTNRVKSNCYLLQDAPITSINSFAQGLSKSLQQHNVTHLHSHLYGATVRGALAAHYAKIPHVATSHDVYTLQEKEARVRWLKVAMKLGTKLVTVSDHMNNTYRDISEHFVFCKFSDQNPITIYNGVDTMRYRPTALIPKSEYLLNVTCVGRLVEVKNHILLIKAIQNIVEQGTLDIRLQIIGDGPLEETLRNYVTENELDPWIRFLGARSDIPDLLNKHDLFVLPSFSEGLSCSILEAMACGLPIIASDVGGNNELVRNNINGWLFPSDDLDALTKKLQLAYNVRKSLPDLGRTSSNTIDEKFSIRTMVDQYLAVYQGK